nr:hypothetical protein [uncultured Romboutsia sp.]
MKKNYYLVGELRVQNLEIFRVMEIDECIDTNIYSSIVGYFVIEDCNRKTELKDYPYLIDVYKGIEDKFEGAGNVIKVYFITDKVFDESEKEYIEFYGTSLVEDKEDTSVLFYHIYDISIMEKVYSYDDEKFKIYNELLNVVEHKINILEYKKESLKRLYQYK